VQYLDQSATAGPRLWAVALEQYERQEEEEGERISH